MLLRNEGNLRIRCNPDRVDEERKRLRMSFDGDPEAYDRARPGYPEQLYSDIISECGLAEHSRLLEIGCGTGKATLAFARRGYSVDAVEIGAHMAEFAAEKTAGYHVNILNVPFEELNVADSTYDLVFAATSFHWIDRQTSLTKVKRALTPRGHLAVFWHSHLITGETRQMFDTLQHAYDGKAPEISRSTVRKQAESSSPEFQVALQESGLFGNIWRRSYRFTENYDADTYIRLLSTYSDHITLGEQSKSSLFAEIRKLIGEMPGGRITKEYETVLFIASNMAKV